MNVRLAKFVTVYLDHPLMWWAIHGGATALGLARPATAWHLTSGHALERLGRARAALARYEAAAALARASDRRADVRWLHAAQFAAERLHAARSAPRVDDPLFACRLEPDAAASPGSLAAIGRFTAEVTHDGLRLFGFARRGVDRVSVELDGHVLRSLRTGGAAARPEFTFAVPRSTLARFPTRALLRVRGDGGAHLRAPGAASGFVVRVPHGDGSLFDRLAAARSLDKKGSLPPGDRELARRREAYLRLYDRAVAAFEERLGRSLFLMYGTLLGAWRDGDLIADDDDFDVGFVSRANDPRSVKEETFGLIERLVEAGFRVSFNRRGRLFRLSHDAEAGAGVHLDVRPLWFQEGRVWAHNHFSMPSDPDDWLPARYGRLGDRDVLVPRRTERFLEGHYGPGWRVPDPAFTYYLDAIPDAVLQNLARALITPGEYRALRSRLERDRCGAVAGGRFASDGWDDLYPLDPRRRANAGSEQATAEHA